MPKMQGRPDHHAKTKVPKIQIEACFFNGELYFWIGKYHYKCLLDAGVIAEFQKLSQRSPGKALKYLKSKGVEWVRLN